MTAQPIRSSDAAPVGTLMAPGWWARGLALHERLAGAPRSPATEQQAALLTEPAHQLTARTARPRWANTVERALHAAAAPDRDEPVPAGWRDAFAVPLRPLVTVAAERVAVRTRRVEHADHAALAAGFAATLGRMLVRLAARTFVTELAAWRRADRLTGADGRERFADFVRGLAAPHTLAKLLAEYPVLARLLGQAVDAHADAHAELLARFADDRPAIVATLLGGVDPGPLVSVESGQGDAHRGGRSVAIVGFADGRRVVYRPRDVTPHIRFAQLTDWLNRHVPGLGLRAVTPLARAGYGWLEYIPAMPLADLDGADRFYRREGALLALLHALHAGDMHYENLIASAEWPVLVDVETVFHPNLPAPHLPADPASVTFAASVHRTALLPMIVVGEHGAVDMSGLGGDPGALFPTSVVGWADPATDQMRMDRRATEFAGAANRPRLDGRDVDAGAHEAALLDGFRLGYDAIVRHATELTELLEDCAGMEVRLVVRPTRGYVHLLDESTHPDLLHDAADRDRMLDVLWTEATGNPLRWRLSADELADLWAGDVPYFSARPGSHDVWTSAGRCRPGLLDLTGLDHSLEKIAAMSDVDRRTQEWIISATLATRRPAGAHDGAEPALGPVAVSAAHPERLLAAACAIGDQIVARSMTDGHRVNWLGLELVDERQWLVLPTGAGFANGYLGIALFLAQLSEISGIDRYGEAALRAVGLLPALLDTVAERPEMVALIGSGALHGFGGIGYALSRMAVLLDDADARRWALTAVRHAAAADPDGPPDWATGSAGCLAALTAVHAELGEPDVARLAIACADRLADRLGTLTEPGFAYGVAGAAWALAGSEHAGAARAALDRVTPIPPERPGWCSGVAGLAVARAGLADTGSCLVEALADRPVLRDLSLCHGELGIVEALTELAGTLPAAAARRRRAGLVLDAIDRYGLSCGTPGGVSTPGLLSGLAGIGYGLLRLGFADRVPSALLLRPATS